MPHSLGLTKEEMEIILSSSLSSLSKKIDEIETESAPAEVRTAKTMTAIIVSSQNAVIDLLLQNNARISEQLSVLSEKRE